MTKEKEQQAIFVVKDDIWTINPKKAKEAKRLITRAVVMYNNTFF
jgi:hypothetical protein